MNLQRIKSIIREQLNQLRNEAKKDCCDDLMGNITHKSDWPGNACPKSHIVVHCEMAPPRPNRSKQTLNEECTASSVETLCLCGIDGDPRDCQGNFVTLSSCDTYANCSCCSSSNSISPTKGPKAPTAYQGKRR